VPGLRGREPKEISVKNLAYVIQARMEEIVEHVYYEIKSSGFEKKLIGGVVITGGGALLKHLNQLVEYVTGLECRVGYPNEHLAKFENMPKTVYDDLKSPMYATSVGLLIKGIQKAEEVLEEMKQPGVIVEPQSLDQKIAKTVTDGGLFGKLLAKTKVFIKDDISDEEYLKH
jgi:cell division protein FtsA